jgi:hypothetical protein
MPVGYNKDCNPAYHGINNQSDLDRLQKDNNSSINSDSPPHGKYAGPENLTLVPGQGSVALKSNFLQDLLLQTISSLNGTYRNEQSFQYDFPIGCLADALNEYYWDRKNVKGLCEQNTVELLNLRLTKVQEIRKIVKEINRLCANPVISDNSSDKDLPET